MMDFGWLKHKKNLVFLVIALALVVVFCVWLINQSRRTAVQLNLYDLSGQIMPEGIVKKSDVTTGSPDTRYALTGRVVKKPSVIDEVWFVTVRVREHQYLMRLGKSQSQIGINEAKVGVMSTTYHRRTVEEIIAKLIPDTPIQAQIVVAYSGQPLSDPACDANCQDLVFLIDHQGQHVQDVLEGAVRPDSDQVVIGPIMQLTFATQ